MGKGYLSHRRPAKGLKPVHPGRRPGKGLKPVHPGRLIRTVTCHSHKEGNRGSSKQRTGDLAPLDDCASAFKGSLSA